MQHIYNGKGIEMANASDENTIESSWNWYYNKEPVSITAKSGQFEKGTVLIRLRTNRMRKIETLVNNEDASHVTVTLKTAPGNQLEKAIQDQNGVWLVKDGLNRKKVVVTCTITKRTPSDRLSLRVSTEDADDTQSVINNLTWPNLKKGDTRTLRTVASFREQT